MNNSNSYLQTRLSALLELLSPSERAEFNARLKLAHRLLLEDELALFVREAWALLEPGTKYQHNWHIDAICEYLSATRTGQIRRLIINIPPRHMKSLLATVCFPCWIWTKEPEKRFIVASYSSDLSVEHSLLRRRIVGSEWYQGHWSDRIQLTATQNQKSNFENARRGQMIATSVGGTVTGKGGDYLIVDDPHSAKQALSDAQRDEAIRFFDQTLSTRLNQPETGVIIVIMQRLHEKDLTGHLLAKGGWTHLCLPAEAEEREKIILPISGRTYVRQAGELLWERRFSRRVLEEQKVCMGTYAYAGQMQQRPSPAGGSILRRDWWRYYEPGSLPDRFDAILQSWDCAFKDTKDADFVVGAVWARSGSRYYLLDLVRGRMDFVATRNAIRSLSAKHPKAITKLVEDKANGPAVIASLKAEIDGLIAVSPEGGKVSRATGVSALIEAGNVFLPDPASAPWVHDFVEECAAFPNGAHDDQVDAMSQALLRLRGQPSGIMGFYQELAESKHIAST